MSWNETIDFVAREMKNSGLPEDSQKYGFESVTANDGATYLRWGSGPVPGDGMAIRYQNWEGEGLIVTLEEEGDFGHPYCRVKPTIPFKDAKYLSPNGVPNQLYIPDQSVLQLARDKGYLAVIEGEKKALAAFLAGEPAVGVAGPFGAMLAGHTEMLTPLLEEGLELIGIPNLTIIFVWDSDAAYNSDFARATGRYGQLFANRGNPVKTLVLPQETLKKVGVDDLILAKGKAEFSRLLSAAKVLEPDTDYHDLQYDWLQGISTIRPGEDEGENQGFLSKVFRKGYLTDFTRRCQDYLLKELTQIGFSGVQKSLGLTTKDHVLGLLGKAKANDEQKAKESAQQEATEAKTPKGRPKKPQEPLVVKANHVYVSGGETVISESPGRAGAVDYTWVWNPSTDVRRVALPGSLHPGKAMDDEKAMLMVLRRGFNLPAENQWGVVSHAGDFFRLEDNRWHRVGEQNLRANIHKIVSTVANIPNSQSVVDTVVKGLRSHWQTLIPVEGGPAAVWVNREWKPAPGEIVTRNCRIQIMDENRKPLEAPLVKALTPGYFHAAPIPVNYNPNAQTSLFQNTLDLFVPDPSLAGYLQEVFGVCLLDETVKTLFFWNGTGNNGKGTFGHTLSHMVGPENVTAVTAKDAASKFEGLPLATRRVNFLGDAPSDALDTEAKSTVIKQITGDDRVHFNVKGSVDSFDRVVTAKVIYCFNNKQPTVADHSQAMIDRLRIIPFDERVEVEKADLDFKHRIVREAMPHVLNWALAGLMRFLHNGRKFSPCPKVEEATAKFWKESDLTKAFVENCLESHPPRRTDQDVVWRAFVGYCADRNLNPGNKNTLWERIYATFPGSAEGQRNTGTHKVRTIIGVQLRFPNS